MHLGMDKFIEKALHGDGDSDRHFISLYAMALASRGKTYVELGVREGHTSEPLYNAAKANDTGVPMSDAWKTYRQTLRDIINSTSTEDITWPTKPT